MKKASRFFNGSPMQLGSGFLRDSRSAVSQSRPAVPVAENFPFTRLRQSSYANNTSTRLSLSSRSVHTRTTRTYIRNSFPQSFQQ